MSDLGINNNFKALMTLMNDKSNKILERLDSQKNGKLDGKISIEDVQLAAKNSKDSDVKEMANYILDHKDFMENLRMNPNNKKSYFKLGDAVDLSVSGKIQASGDDFEHASNDYDKRNAAMSILSQHKNMLDKASSDKNDGTDSKDGADDNFNVRDLYNLAKSDKAPKEVKDAAKYIADNQGIVRDIDGDLHKVNGYSDGNFSWGDFQRAQGDMMKSNFKLTGYDNDARQPSNGEIDNDSRQKSMGDCWVLSATKAVADTDQGKELIKNAITPKEDGSYDVVFPGDKNKIYNIKEAEYKKYVGGDRDMQIIAAAADQHFKENGGKGIGDGGDPMAMMKLLSGVDDNKAKSVNYNNNADEIKKFLLDEAPHIGKDHALTASAHVGDDGNVSFHGAGDHAVTITNIDPKTGEVTYLNPWDTSKERKTNIDWIVNGMTDDKSGGWLQSVDLKKDEDNKGAAAGLSGIASAGDRGSISPFKKADLPAQKDNSISDITGILGQLLQQKAINA